MYKQITEYLNRIFLKYLHSNNIIQLFEQTMFIWIDHTYLNRIHFNKKYCTTADQMLTGLIHNGQLFLFSANIQCRQMSWCLPHIPWTDMSVVWRWFLWLGWDCAERAKGSAACCWLLIKPYPHDPSYHPLALHIN